MLFNSAEFIIFFTVFCCVFFLTPAAWMVPLLLVGSYLFYMAWNPLYIFLIIGSTLIDYICGHKISESESPQRKRLFLITSIASNLTILFIFKYYYFTTSNLQLLFESFDYQVNFPVLDLLLPIGISFYTYQSMSYSVDIYYQRIKPEKSILRFALFVSFFPQLVAGPIERAKNLLPQLYDAKTFDFKRVNQGLMLMFYGLFLKVVLADNIAIFVDSVFSNLSPVHHGAPFILAVYGFWLQLYFDFAGYSIIAIGAAKVMGFNLSKNFNAPFLARNIAQFWHRWHITLSTWFRDYAFMPFYLWLDKRVSLPKSLKAFKHGIVFFFAIVVTDVLLGFWHGAAWGYGLFGLYHAVMISFFYTIRKQWTRLPLSLQIFLTFQIVAISGIFFRLRDMEPIIYVSKNLVTGNPMELIVILSSGVILIISEFLWNRIQPNLNLLYESQWLQRAAFFGWIYLFVAAILFYDYFNSAPARPFLYFQF